MRFLTVVMLGVFLTGCMSSDEGALDYPPTQEVIEDVAERVAISIGSQTFNVEVVSTQKERAEGLMWRSQLEENTGMLFVFPHSKKWSFWMKNTFVPLDIIWIREDGTIVDIISASPCVGISDDCKTFTPKKSARWVLEVPQFSFNGNIGEKVKGLPLN